MTPWMERRIALTASSGVTMVPGRDHYLHVVAIALDMSYQEVARDFLDDKPWIMEARFIAKINTLGTEYGLDTTKRKISK